jgi:hypothetical protein
VLLLISFKQRKIFFKEEEEKKRTFITHTMVNIEEDKLNRALRRPPYRPYITLVTTPVGTMVFTTRTMIPRFILWIIVATMMKEMMVEGVTVDKIRLHYANDFRTCPSTQYDHHFNVTDDGNCHQLFPANETINLGSCYYRTYSEALTKKLAFIGRCDCEFITSVSGHRVYNRSCSLGRIAEARCMDLSGVRKGRTFTKFFGTLEKIRYVSLETI